MKFLKFMMYRKPEDGSGSGGSGGEGEGQPGGQGEGQSEGGNSRPEWLPEQFYSEDEGPQYEKLGQSYNELVTKLRSTKDELRAEVKEELAGERPEGVPDSPDGYEFRTPEIDLPEGAEIKIDEKDPLLSFWRETAHKTNMTQEQFDDGIKMFFERELQTFTTEAEQLAQLGERANERVERVDNYLSANLPEDQYAALVDHTRTAKALEAIETLLEKAGHKIPPLGSGEGKAEGLTREKLNEMMDDPRYYDTSKRDPEFVKKVTEGFQALYQE